MADTSDEYFTMQGLGDPVSASGQGEKAGSQASSSNDCSSSLVGNLATGEYTITGRKLSDKTSSLQKRRQKSNKRTAELLSEELEERKKKRRLYMKNYRAKQSKEATQARLQHLRQSAAERRDTESEQAKKARLQQMRQHAAETRDSESELAKEARLQQMRQHAAETQDSESELAKEARLQQMRQHAAETRDSKSELAKEARLQQKSGDSANRRIVCPYDPKHSCYVSQLEKHIKKCNAKPSESPMYIAKDINIKFLDAIDPVIIYKKTNICDVSSDTLFNIIGKIDVISKEIPEIAVEVHNHSVLNEELKKPQYGSVTQKHMYQNSSLLGHLENSGLLQDKTCYVEFGAGRGQLSFWLSKALNGKKQCAVLLIDKGSQRHKCDNRLKNKDTLTVRRIRADISDLILNSVDVVSSCDHTVAVSKHLCGSGTDLALGCLASTVCSSSNIHISGIVMALCCHHRCDWKSYSGKRFLLNYIKIVSYAEVDDALIKSDHGFTADDFSILCSIASWATCGFSKLKSKECHNNSEAFHKTNLCNNNEFMNNTLGLSQENREDIGRKCKHILDYGRIRFLEDYNFSAKLIHYVDSTVSLENVCIIAIPRS